MKKIAVIALVIFAFPMFASIATAMAEKPVAGPKDVLPVLNDLPYEGDEDQGAASDAQPAPEPEPEPEAEAEDEVPYDEIWEEEQEAWFADACSWDEEVSQGGDAGADDFRSQGVVYDDGTRYTWYSENVLPGSGLTELNENGRTVNDDGFVTDGNGRIAIASSDYPIGTELDTPFGPATVYDTGCPSGTIDVYTNF